MRTMDKIDPQLITDRLEAGTISRKIWGDGHEIACLLAAIHPPCAEETSFSVCPASLMPQWMAEMTLWFGYGPGDEHYEAIARRYAALAGRWWVLDDSAWKILEYKFRKITVIEYQSIEVIHPKARASMEKVIMLLNRSISGWHTPLDEWGYGAWAVDSNLRALSKCTAYMMAISKTKDPTEEVAAMEIASNHLINMMFDALEQEINYAEQENSG